MAVKKNIVLGYYKEGANKAAPNFTNVAGNRLRLQRQVNSDLGTNLQSDRSNEIRNDGQVSGSVTTGASAGGTINGLFSLDTYDDYLASILYAADVNDAGTGREDGWRQGGFTPLADILAIAGTVTFQVSDGSFNGTFLRAPAAGERIFVRGFGNKNLDTVWVVAAGATTSKIVVENDTGMATVADYAGVAANVASTAVTITPVKGYTRAGTFQRPFGLVPMYSDTEAAGTAGTTGLNAVDWALIRKSIPTGIQIAVAPGTAGMTISIPFLSSDEIIIEDATSTSNVGSFQITNWDELEPLNSNPLTNAIQSVLMVRLRKVGAAVTTATRTDPQSFNINVTNGSTEVTATRNLGAIEVIGPAVGATVQLSLLYIDPTYHKAMIAEDRYELEIAIGDSDGRAQLWRFPRCKITSQRPNPGLNQPVLQSLTCDSEPGGAGFIGTGRTVEILSNYLRVA